MNAEQAKTAKKVLTEKLNYLYKVEKKLAKNPIIKIVGISSMFKLDSKIIENDINNRNFAKHDKKPKLLNYYMDDGNNTRTVIMEITKTNQG